MQRPENLSKLENPACLGGQGARMVSLEAILTYPRPPSHCPCSAHTHIETLPNSLSNILLNKNILLKILKIHALKEKIKELKIREKTHYNKLH